MEREAANKQACIIASIGVAIMVIGFSFWQHLWVNAWFHSVSIGTALILYGMSKCIEKPFDIVISIYFGWACGWVIDELFFDASKFEWGRYVAAIMSVIYGYHQFKKWKHRRT